MSDRTYGALRLLEEVNRWELDKIEPHVSIRLKQLFPKIPRIAVCPYTLPNTTTAAADLCWFTSRYPLDMSAEDRAALTGGRLQFEACQADMERILMPAWKPTGYAGLRPGQALRDYQAVPIEICLRSKGILVGDECGLGKTYEGAGMCLAPGALPAAIVVQGHVQKQWVTKLREFTTLRVCAIESTKQFSLPPADVYVFRYSNIRGWIETFAKGVFRTVIFDEPQELRTGVETAKGAAAGILSDHAEFRMGLTATPIYGYGVEIWNVMRFINRDVLGDYLDFFREWVRPGTGRLSDPKALGTFLREQYAFLRRTKVDVGREMAPVTRIIHYVDYDANKVAEVEQLARQLAIKATTASFAERGQAARELDLLVRQSTGIAKAKQVAAFVRMLVEGGAPVVLFGWHREVYRIWLEELRDLQPLLYTGSETASQKDKAKEAFLAGKSDLLILSLRSGAGLDGLQARCSTVVFGELDWSPGIHHQCIERIDRDGQPDPVTAIFLVVDEGSDPPMMELVGLKAAEAHQVIDPHMGVTVVEMDETRLQALAKRYLAKRSGKGGKTPAPDQTSFFDEQAA